MLTYRCTNPFYKNSIATHKTFLRTKTFSMSEKSHTWLIVHIWSDYQGRVMKVSTEAPQKTSKKWIHLIPTIILPRKRSLCSSSLGVSAGSTFRTTYSKTRVRSWKVTSCIWIIIEKCWTSLKCLAVRDKRRPPKSSMPLRGRLTLKEGVLETWILWFRRCDKSYRMTTKTRSVARKDW